MKVLQNKLSEKMKKNVHYFATYDVCEGKEKIQNILLMLRHQL